MTPLVSILEQEFSEELPEPLPRKLAPILLGNKSIQAVFSKYDLRDDLTEVVSMSYSTPS